MRYIYSEEMVKRLFSLSIITMHKNLNETDTPLKMMNCFHFSSVEREYLNVQKCEANEERLSSDKRTWKEGRRKFLYITLIVFKSREKTRVLDIKYILDGFFSAWCGKGHGNSLLCTTNIFCIGAISLLNCFLFRVSV